MKETTEKKSFEKQIRVLVVDDDAFIRDLLKRYLTHQGYDALTAEDGDGAMELIASTPCDVAFIDMLLPGMDGLHLIDRIIEAYPGTAVIIITGHPTLESALEAMKRGVHDYLIKPFKLEHLESVLQKCLDQRRILEENRDLKERLDEARQRIRRYETLFLQHPLVSAHNPGDGGEQQLRGGAAYRIQSRQGRKEALRDQLNRMQKLVDDGVISKQEYEQRRKVLISLEETFDESTKH